MTGHKGNSEFCLSETLEGKQNSLFPKGPVIKCFVIPADSEIEKKNPKNMICSTPLHTLAALAKLSGWQNQPVLSKNHKKQYFFSQVAKNIGSIKVALASCNA